MRVYIAGPMTGLVGYNFPAFFDAERRLRELGHETFNPARNDGGVCPETAFAEAYRVNRSREDYMREDIQAILGCDAIYFLPGWESSRGAKVERIVAEAIGLVEVTL